MISRRLHAALGFWRTLVQRRWLVRAFIIVGWIVILALLAWAGWKNRDILLTYFVHARWERLWWVILWYCASLSCVLIGWVMIMRTLHTGLYNWVHIRIYAMTLVARRLPGTLWYVGGRLALYETHQVPRRVTLLASGIEVIIMAVTGGVIGISLLFASRSLSGTQMFPPTIAALIGLVCIIGVILVSPGVLQRLLRWRRPELLPPPIRWRHIIGWMLAFSGMWLAGGLMTASLVSAIQLLQFWDYIYIIGCWALAGVAGIFTMPFPSSFGASELTLAALLTQLMPLPLAGAIAILVRLVTMLIEILLAVLSYFFLLQK